MKYRELESSINIEVEGDATIDGVVIPAEVIKTTLYGRIWSSAQVVKNKRESVNTSIKATIGQALQMGLIDSEEGLQLMLNTDKTRINELRAQMPQTEKSKEPTEEDVEVARKQFLENKGQRA